MICGIEPPDNFQQIEMMRIAVIMNPPRGKWFLIDWRELNFGAPAALNLVTPGVHMLPASLDNDDPLADDFRRFVARPDFPCIGAKSALAKRQLHFVVARDMTSAWDDLRIYPALFNFARRYHADKKLFQSLVVLFRGPLALDELNFERCLWERLQSLTDKDSWHGQPHDERVSADPGNPHFSLSFANEGFFVLGLHPEASRPARRFSNPAIVFNLHDQFEELRRQNRYGKLRHHILERDQALSGSINPMLQVFGEASEARQYSGRRVDEGWECPYRRDAALPKRLSFDFGG